MDDAQLVQATLNGDQSAFGELVRRYRDAAFGIAFHRLGDFEAARDAAQEALITAYTDLGRLREPSKFGHWLYQIATTTALGLLRRRRPALSLEAADECPDTTPSPAESAERTEKARQVREALEILQESDRLALILHYVNGYSHDEVGSMLGATTSSIKSRIHRARGRLREEMQQMVESTLKSEAPGIEFSESLVRMALEKDKEHGFASLAYIIPGRMEYTAQTQEAICRIASELAEEGYSWLIAPPHIPEGSPAIEMLKGIGFQVELELHWYERSLTGRLPAVPPLDPGIEIRGFSEADPKALLALFEATILKEGPAMITEDIIREQQRAPDRVPEASFVAYRDGRVVALLASYQALWENPKYETDSGILWYVMEDDASDALRHVLASALRRLKSLGLKRVVKDQLQPNYPRDQRVISVLKAVGFKFTRLQYVPKLNLKSRAWETCPGRPTTQVPIREFRPIQFSVEEGDRPAKYATALQVKVSEVLGTSNVLGPGEVYIVSGEYTLSEPIVPTLYLGNSGEFWGFITHLSVLTPGTHPFSAGANILAVNPGKEDTLHLHTPGLEEDDVRHAIIRLKP